MEGVDGFVCPICYAALGSQAELMSHFEQLHSGGSEDTGTIWGKARATAKRIYHNRMGDAQAAQEGGEGEATQYIKPIIWEEQTMGVVRRSSPKYRTLRKQRTDRADLAQNQLLHRLDKLLYKGPSIVGIGKSAVIKARKEYEKTVVTWMDDTLVPICPGCGNSFGMLRRRHHCRLCGSVLCADCSFGLDVATGINLLKKSSTGSSTSLLSLNAGGADNTLDRKLKIGEDEMLRVCEFCHTTLTSALSVKTQKKKKAERPSPLVIMHDKMVQEMNEAVDLLPAYNSLAFALMRHEQLERYEEAQDKRNRIAKKFEAVDLISKKILNANKSTADPNLSSQVLQRAVRKRVAEYLQQYMITLMKLPEARTVLSWRREELEKDRAKAHESERKRQQIMKSMQRRNQPDGLGQPPPNRNSNSQRRSNPKPPNEKHLEKEQSREEPIDPSRLKEETRISLRKCLKQAQRAGKLDEVEALQLQLQELENF